MLGTTTAVSLLQSFMCCCVVCSENVPGLIAHIYLRFCQTVATRSCTEVTTLRFSHVPFKTTTNSACPEFRPNMIPTSSGLFPCSSTPLDVLQRSVPPAQSESTCVQQRMSITNHPHELFPTGPLFFTVERTVIVFDLVVPPCTCRVRTPLAVHNSAVSGLSCGVGLQYSSECQYAQST